MLPSHGRFEYSPITARVPFEWPQKKRLGVYVAVALEHFPYGEGALGLSMSPGIPQPNTYNWAWREYGNRVGGWRLLDLLREHQIPPTVLLNSSCYEHCPELVDAYRVAGAEFVAHGVTNAVHPNGLTEFAERDMIEAATKAIRDHEGAPPSGWMSPGANPSRVTEDLLREVGYAYTLDWPMDDQPVWMATRDGNGLLSVPYPHEVNDVPMIVLHDGSAREYADMAIDTIEELLRNPNEQSVACGIVAHSFIIGQPHRMHHFRRVIEHLRTRADDIWLTTPGQIATTFAEQVPFA